MYHQAHPRGTRGKRTYASETKALAVAKRASRMKKACIGVFRNFDAAKVAMFCNGRSV